MNRHHLNQIHSPFVKYWNTLTLFDRVLEPIQPIFYFLFLRYPNLSIICRKITKIKTGIREFWKHYIKIEGLKHRFLNIGAGKLNRSLGSLNRRAGLTSFWGGSFFGIDFEVLYGLIYLFWRPWDICPGTTK